MATPIMVLSSVRIWLVAGWLAGWQLAEVVAIGGDQVRVCLALHASVSMWNSIKHLLAWGGLFSRSAPPIDNNNNSAELSFLKCLCSKYDSDGRRLSCFNCARLLRESSQVNPQNAGVAAARCWWKLCWQYAGWPPHHPLSARSIEFGCISPFRFPSVYRILLCGPEIGRNLTASFAKSRC